MYISENLTPLTQIFPSRSTDASRAVASQSNRADGTSSDGDPNKTFPQ